MVPSKKLIQGFGAAKLSGAAGAHAGGAVCVLPGVRSPL